MALIFRVAGELANGPSQEGVETTNKFPSMKAGNG